MTRQQAATCRLTRWGWLMGQVFTGMLGRTPGRYIDRKGEQLDLSYPFRALCSIVNNPAACMGLAFQRFMSPAAPQYCEVASESFDLNNPNTFLPPVFNNSGQRPSKTPNTGPPGSRHINPGCGQIRDYGPDGRPIKDIDFDHDHGQGIPHVHDWGRMAHEALVGLSIRKLMT